MENIVSEKIDRRKFLAGAGASSLVLVSLGGCGAGQKREPGKPHYGMVFDQNKCVGCGTCADICNSHIFVHDRAVDRVPQVRFPDECWHCGCCRIACPTGSIAYRFPMTMML